MSLKPYYEHAGITIYHGDCRYILPQLPEVDTVITDPVWPNSSKELIGAERPAALFAEMCRVLPQAKRLIVHLGCDSDSRFLGGVPSSWPFLRLAWLRYACPTRKGRCLYGADVAHIFGTYPKSIPGRRVISGEYCSAKPDVLIVLKNFMARAVSPSLESRDRTPQDYAIEHAEYLAKAVEGFLEALGKREMARDEADSEELNDAEMVLSDHWNGLQTSIYEFRKRAFRAAPPDTETAPPQPEAANAT